MRRLRINVDKTIYSFITPIMYMCLVFLFPENVSDNVFTFRFYIVTSCLVAKFKKKTDKYSLIIMIHCKILLIFNFYSVNNFYKENVKKANIQNENQSMMRELKFP